MQAITYLLFTTLITSAVVWGEVIRSGSLQAMSDGANVTLRWATEDETNVARFEIERRTGAETDFKSIATVEIKGTSSYEFVDYSAFKKPATIYQYRIRVVFSNGANPLYTQVLTVSHTVSGVRKTWGSIKAMFR